MIGDLIAAIGVAVPLIQAGLTDRLKYRDEALVALYIALTETEAYMSKIQATESPNPEKSMELSEKQSQLSQLWFRASVPIRHFDKDLADLCEWKHAYWASPDSWVAPDPNVDKQIEIAQMRTRFEDMRSRVLTAFLGTRTSPE